MSRSNVTPIEFLPNLEDLEGNRSNFNKPQPYPGSYTSNSGNSYATNNTYPGASLIPQEEAERVGRFIRGGHSAPVEAGMIPYNNAVNSNTTNIEAVLNNENNMNIEQKIIPVGLKTFSMPPDSPSCLSVAEHVANCPICSRFYNNDKTIYIIAIVVLLIICILLLKKVLDV